MASNSTGGVQAVYCMALVQKITSASAASTPVGGGQPGAANARAKILASHYDLSSFGIFRKGSVSEFLTFFIKTVVERTGSGARQQIAQDEYIGHVYVRSDGLAAVMVTGNTYPKRVAFSILNRLVEEFASLHPSPAAWDRMAENAAPYPALANHLEVSKNPESSDPFMKVQRELDETKIVLHKTMEALLQRGEKLDDLVAKSDALSAQSKMFYKTAKSTNQCSC